MFAMYILKNLKSDDLYIGFTNDLNRRLREHNSGAVSSTKKNAPHYLVYAELYRDEDEARHREYALKLRGRARHQLLLRIRKSIGA